MGNPKHTINYLTINNTFQVADLDKQQLAKFGECYLYFSFNCFVMIPSTVTSVSTAYAPLSDSFIPSDHHHHHLLLLLLLLLLLHLLLLMFNS
jgi:hypothetical protein